MLRKTTFVPGEYYHLYNRGIDKRIIFKSLHDYRRFIMLLYVANSTHTLRLDNLINMSRMGYKDIFYCERGNELVSIGAWCLMPNHFHLLVKEKTEGGISKFMKKLGTAYSMYFNIKYQRTGSLFGGPFKAQHIPNDRYLKHMFGYMGLNPLDIKFSNWQELVDTRTPRHWQKFLREYSYSSYIDYRGISRPENSILDKKAFPAYFSTEKDFDDFIESYLSFDLDNSLSA